MVKPILLVPWHISRVDDIDGWVDFCDGGHERWVVEEVPLRGVAPVSGLFVGWSGAGALGGGEEVMLVYNCVFLYV